MKRMKSILAVVLAYSMVIGNMASGAFASTAVAAEDIYAWTDVVDEYDAEDVFAAADEFVAEEAVAEEAADNFFENAEIVDVFASGTNAASDTQKKDDTDDKKDTVSETETGDDTTPASPLQTTSDFQTLYGLDDDIMADLKNYEGDPAELAFEADGTPKIWFGNVDASYPFTGSAIKPDVHVYEGFTRLAVKKDYTLKYGKNKKAGSTGTITVKFKKNYKKNLSVSFAITKAKLGVDVIALDTSLVLKNDKKAKKAKPVLVNVHTGKKVKFNTKVFEMKDIATNAKASASSFQVTVTPKAGNNDYEGSDQALIIPAKKAELISKAKLVWSNGLKAKKAIAEYTGDAIVVGMTGKDEDLTIAPKKDGVSFTIVSATQLVASNLQTASGTQKVMEFKDPGTGAIVIQGDGKTLKGQRLVTYKIQKGAKVNGKTKAGVALPKDWTIKFSDNVQSKVVSGTNAVSSAQAAAVSAAQAASATQVYYAKKAAGFKPQNVTLIDPKGNTLVMNVDFTVSAKKKNAGEKTTLTIKFKGKKYQGKYTYEVPVAAVDLATQVAVEVKKVTSTKATVNVYSLVDGNKLGKGDFEAKLAADKKSVTIEAKNANYKGTQTVKLGDGTKVMSSAKISFVKGTFTYNGKPVSVAAGNIKKAYWKKKANAMTFGTDYAPVAYVKNVNKGKGLVIFQGNGQYYGGKAVKFTIGQKKDSTAKTVYTDGSTK